MIGAPAGGALFQVGNLPDPPTPLMDRPKMPARRQMPSAAADAGFVLETIGLTAGYDDLPAVRDLSIGVRAGEIVALFGPNGAGKTTTLLACVGLLPCMSGEIRWLGDPNPQPMHRLARSGLAYVPEGRSVTTGLSVRDNLRIGRGDVDDAVSIFPELEPLLDRPAGLLSGGEQQMLVLGRAIASRPRALLVDELSLGLAPLVVDRLLGALREFARRDELAVLLVEQQAREALSVADRWYLLRDGSLAHQGDAGSGVSVLEAAYLSSMSSQRGPELGALDGAVNTNEERR
jgi:branched-chain amino acid transport system ATP-binding protein